MLFHRSKNATAKGVPRVLHQLPTLGNIITRPVQKVPVGPQGISYRGRNG